MRPCGPRCEDGSVVYHFGDPVNIGVRQNFAKLPLRKTDPKEVTQMVTDRKKDSEKTPVKQGPEKVSSEPNKIGPATPYDFDGKNLTAYGGLLPVGTLLEKLGFRQLVEETLKVKRQTRVMPAYQFILAMVLACYVGFSRLHHLRFVQREPMLTGILGVLRLPPQCTFWRFLASLHGSVAGQLLEVQRCLRQRVWEAANVGLTAVVLDTDTTVHTLFGNQMGARKSYNPKNKGKKSFQPILTFLAETKEYIAGELHNDAVRVLMRVFFGELRKDPMQSGSSCF